VNDVSDGGITCSQTQWMICSRESKEKNIHLMVVSSPRHADNVAAATEWAKVAKIINNGQL